MNVTAEAAMANRCIDSILALARGEHPGEVYVLNPALRSRTGARTWRPLEPDRQISWRFRCAAGHFTMPLHPPVESVPDHGCLSRGAARDDARSEPEAAPPRRRSDHRRWISFAESAVAEIMARTGFDWILIDTEHAPFSPEG